MPIDESLELILEVLANRKENREYQLYLSTITLFGLNGKLQDYQDFREGLVDKSYKKTKRLSKEEKERIKERNKNVIKYNFKRVD